MIPVGLKTRHRSFSAVLSYGPRPARKSSDRGFFPSNPRAEAGKSPWGEPSTQKRHCYFRALTVKRDGVQLRGVTLRWNVRHYHKESQTPGWEGSFCDERRGGEGQCFLMFSKWYQGGNCLFHTWPEGPLQHWGIADLPGDCSVCVCGECGVDQKAFPRSHRSCPGHCPPGPACSWRSGNRGQPCRRRAGGGHYGIRIPLWVS